jgi:hypothetical protein
MSPFWSPEFRGGSQIFTAEPNPAQQGQAKPSPSVNWGRRLARSASQRPRLLAIPAFDRIDGVTGEYAYANDFKVRLRALTDLLKTSA